MVQIIYLHSANIFTEGSSISPVMYKFVLFEGLH